MEHVGTASWRTRYRVACNTLAPYLLLGLLPVLFWAGALINLVDLHGVAYDFHTFFYPQARDLIEGRVPATAYPPLASLVFVPFALLPVEIADGVVTAAMFACAGATLAVLGVRDWRCYGAAAIWPPVYAGIQAANLSLVLALGVALLWRWRASALTAGAVVAFMVALKLFLWPLAVWLVSTRRWRATGAMLGVGILASVAAWTVVGFGAVMQFPALVRGNVQDNGTMPYTLVAILRQLGASAAVGYAVCWALGAAVAAAGARVAQSGREADALALFLGAALIVSPIVWLHYLVLLLVPVALARPRFSRLWLAPFPLWLVAPVDGTLLEKSLLMIVGAAIIAHAIGIRRAGYRLRWTTAGLAKA